jgi:Zn-dependent protease with chaperone function
MIGFLLFSDALAPMDAVVKLLMNILSRKFEFEAGMFNPQVYVDSEPC